MLFVDAATLSRRLDPRRLVASLREGFGSGMLHAPLRHAHVVQASPAGQDSLLLMPAWRAGEFVGVKLVTVMTAQARSGGRTVNALYVLFDGASGEPVACLDGDVLTTRRTAAQSALAALYLARPDAKRFLMVGTGALSQAMVEGHAAVRVLSEIVLWGRDRFKAEERARSLADVGIDASVAVDLEAAVRAADIICCATTARSPLVMARWLRPGQHVDLVGAFRPDMCEADPASLARASVFVDTRAGCLAEAGEIVQAIASGLLSPDDIVADLADLCGRRHPGRRSEEEITLFKSVGTASADFVAAQLTITTEDAAA